MEACTIFAPLGLQRAVSLRTTCCRGSEFPPPSLLVRTGFISSMALKAGSSRGDQKVVH